MQVMYHQKGFLQLTTPGCNDILVFEEKTGRPVGQTGGIAHFGFRLRNANEIDEMVGKIILAGGEIIDKGEFIPGSPYVFFKDPDGYEVEVVDLRSVKPLDTDTILASVARTGRLLCVSEAWPWGGVAAEVIARVATEGFGLLDAPPQRLNAKDTPVPYHPNLWAAHRPTVRAIGAAARKILRH